MIKPKKEKCEACYGSGYINFRTDDGHISMRTCRRCDGYGYINVEPMTNEEWFTNLTTEEKAKMLGRVSFCDFCSHQLSEHCAWTTGYSEDCVYGNKENEELWMEWLKEIHNEKA